VKACIDPGQDIAKVRERSRLLLPYHAPLVL
jgi:hypothetical protein